jgi:glycine cleavage system H protein
MNIPENIFYTKEHEFVSFDNNIATIGITSFAAKELGDIVFVEIEKSLNVVINANETFGIVEAVKTVSDLFLPVTGKIIEINQKILDEPSLINENPYENWLIKVEIVGNDRTGLLSASEYKKLIGYNEH